jgi:inositol-1,4,5-trisphosphate 5-phosphatase
MDYRSFSFIYFLLDNIFVPVFGKEVHSGNIENVTIKEKAKFPKEFFPEVRLDYDLI